MDFIPDPHSTMEPISPASLCLGEEVNSPSHPHILPYMKLGIAQPLYKAYWYLDHYKYNMNMAYWVLCRDDQQPRFIMIILEIVSHFNTISSRIIYGWLKYSLDFKCVDNMTPDVPSGRCHTEHWTLIRQNVCCRTELHGWLIDCCGWFLGGLFQNCAQQPYPPFTMAVFTKIEMSLIVYFLFVISQHYLIILTSATWKWVGQHNL